MKHLIKPLVILSISAVLLGVAVYLHSIDHPTIHSIVHTTIKQQPSQSTSNLNQSIASLTKYVSQLEYPIVVYKNTTNTTIHPSYHSTPPPQIPPPWYATLWPIPLIGGIVGVIYSVVRLLKK